MGGPGVLITMSSQFGANTLAVTRALEEALAGLKPVFASKGIKVYPRLHRPATGGVLDREVAYRQDRRAHRRATVLMRLAIAD